MPRRKPSLEFLNEVHFGAPKPIQAVPIQAVALRVVQNRKLYQDRRDATFRRQAEIEAAIALVRREKELLRAVGRLN